MSLPHPTREDDKNPQISCLASLSSAPRHHGSWRWSSPNKAKDENASCKADTSLEELRASSALSRMNACSASVEKWGALMVSTFGPLPDCPQTGSQAQVWHQGCDVEISRLWDNADRGAGLGVLRVPPRWLFVAVPSFYDSKLVSTFFSQKSQSILIRASGRV